jgi:hypothetical protein
VPFYFINLLPTSLLYISILLVCGLGGWAERMGALRKNHENNLLPAGANAAAAGAESSTNALLILIYFGRHDAEPGGESGSLRSQESGAGANGAFAESGIGVRIAQKR